MRPLTLHHSALSDTEYGPFMSAMHDLVSLEDAKAPSFEENGAYYESALIIVRDTRTWLRGRYPNIPLNDIDRVNKYHNIYSS